MKMFALCIKSGYRCNALTRLYNTEALQASSAIRSRFLDYFVSEKDHTYIRSSPLRPISDPTIPFVNAGMVQFKSVLQGKTLPPALRAANSQKCARVGGKHNDLDTVGMDGYHHTFFEMLGNWSFGSCNKEQACAMAWDLLTGPYGLNPKRLYVTYFGGDDKMGLQPDFDTREIWRQLGVEESHIIPFGARENFWEMGLVGPCGPCSEIHVDHIRDRQNAGDRVNAGFSDLTELWNLVFIQFNRTPDGSLEPVKQSHLDTGMGFERLVAVLNGVESNYDTDLFKPLMEAIHKISGLPRYSNSFDKSDAAFERDRAYRIMCDHSRLLTVALADGVVPHNECKVRWVLRRALNIAHDVMKKDENLLVELSNFVADSLHFYYPEIGRNLSKVQRIILDEAEIYKALKLDCPKEWLNVIKENPTVEGLLEFGSNRKSLAVAFRKIISTEGSEISSTLAFHLYDSHGMSNELISEMARLSGKKFDVQAYEKELEAVKNKSKLVSSSGINTSTLLDIISSAHIPETDYTLMYEYDLTDEGYTFPTVSAKVVGLLVDGMFQTKAFGGTECGVILDKTNFYHSAGGQVCDDGEILITSGQRGRSLLVKEVTKVGGYVIHFGNLNGSLQVGEEVTTKINESNRVACMRNHTLAHLINGEMQNLFDAPLQEKCVVDPLYVKLSYYLHGEEFKADHAKTIEDALTHAIEDELKVDRYSVNTWHIPQGTTLVPDESYPVDNIHIIDIKRGKNVVSREACCGTHVLNTKDVGKFCIAEVMKSKNNTSICAVTGSEADEAGANSLKLTKDIKEFFQHVLKVEKMVKKLNEEVNNAVTVPAIKKEVDEIKKVYKKRSVITEFMKENSRRCSYAIYDAAVKALEDGSSKTDGMARYLSELEVKRKADDSRIVCHVMQLSEFLEKMPLRKYTKLVDVPIMLFALHSRELKVRCCIPKALVSEDFNALLWMQEAMSQLMQSDRDAEEYTEKQEGLSASVQSRTLLYKSRISARQRKQRCWNASAVALKFAQSQIKMHSAKQKEQ